KGKNAGRDMREGGKRASPETMRSSKTNPDSGSEPMRGSKTNPDLNAVHEHMDVIASCGTKVGVVDHMEGNAIKLTKNDSPDGQHHFIPADWVERVDDKVHLRPNSKETEMNWKADAASCGCG